VQNEDYTTSENALKVCGILSVDQVFDQQMTRPEEEEVAEHKIASEPSAKCHQPT
jgi:hypothetical protein